MFASDDEFDKQLAVEKEKREQDVQKKKDMLKKTEDVENTALKDNWDRDTLHKYGAGTGLSLMAIQSFGQQLFLALHHIKKLGIVHADIKPDNIMLKDQNSSLIQVAPLFLRHA